jgi:hypothetical protein
MARQLEEIKCTFNIFDNGRKFSGENRGYVLDNVASVLNSGFSKERIANREAVGYYSHGVRRMAGLDPEETTSVIIQGKPVVINCTPSNLTADQSIDRDGNITHTQQILDNDEGRKALGLHNSQVGGFSWACSPAASSGAGTLIGKFFGYDYVRNPLFLRNKGHILDSVVNQDQMILDSMLATGLDPDKAQAAVAGLLQDSIMDAEHYREQLESAILDRGVMDAALTQSKDAMSKLEGIRTQVNTLTVQISADKALRQHILDNVLTSFNVGAIPDDISGQVLDGSPAGLDALFGLIGRSSIKASALGGTQAESISTAAIGDWGDKKAKDEFDLGFNSAGVNMRNKHFS